MSFVHPEFLIEPAELASRLDAGDVRVFDATVFLEPAETGYRAVSGQEKYAAGHIPGAAFLDQIVELSDTSSGLGFTVPAPEILQAALGAAGIEPGVTTVLYSGGHMMWATRAWWLLHYAGHEDVKVLDGGFAGWRGAGLPVSDDPFVYPAVVFDAAPRPERFVDRNVVLEAIGAEGTCTVNALAPGVYAGSAEMSYGRKGHITGSVNLPYDELLDGGRFRPAAEVSLALRERGLLAADQVIAYCGGGISATIDAFACLLVGKDEIAVYDGSMSEWVRDETLPMTIGLEPG